MTSQKRDPPHRDSDKHWPFLVEVARTLYGNAEFAISSARRFSAPVSKFEESPGKIQCRTNQNIAQVQRIEAERKIRELLNAVSRYFICSPGGKCFQRILINFDDCVEISIPLPK